MVLAGRCMGLSMVLAGRYIGLFMVLGGVCDCLCSWEVYGAVYGPGRCMGGLWSWLGDFFGAVYGPGLEVYMAVYGPGWEVYGAAYCCLRRYMKLSMVLVGRCMGLSMAQAGVWGCLGGVWGCLLF